MNSTLPKCAALFLVFLIAAVLAPVSGWSQSEQGAEGDVGQIEVSDEEVSAFAKAQQQVAGIQQKYTALVSEEQDVDKQQEIAQEANEKMVVAVEDQGFDVQRYNMIANAAQSDTDLQQRIIVATQQLE